MRVEVVAACESDAAASAAAEGAGARITHSDPSGMLRDVDCDVVAIGEYFARRGSAAIHALNEGKHVIVDKPLCTSLDELDEIERIARQTQLKCRVHVVDAGSRTDNRRADVDPGKGTIGEIHCDFIRRAASADAGQATGLVFRGGQTRRHDQTTSAIHAIDCLPWITGLEFESVNAARCWNAFAPEFPHFHDGAQMMLTMDNGLRRSRRRVVLHAGQSGIFPCRSTGVTRSGAGTVCSKQVPHRIPSRLRGRTRNGWKRDRYRKIGPEDTWRRF